MNRKTNYIIKRFGWFILLLIVSQVASAQRTISGVITDSDSSEPLIGASVLVSGTSIGTVSDYDGTYTLEVSPDATQIEVSYTGYTSEVIPIGVSNSIDIQLSSGELLDEVVVVGYGVTKKSDVTGAVASVDVAEIKKLASVDVTNTLQGKVPGLTITSNSGAPGTGSSVRIRGVGSFQNSDPLYVVDGFLTGDISNINPSEIESIEVLKDASATAIYGSRGANGVILITTKNGSSGKEQAIIEINSFGGFQSPNKFLDVLDAQDYAELYLEAVSDGEDNLDAIVETSKRSWVFDALALEELGTDWQDYIFNERSSIMNHSVAIRGSGKGYNYNVGGLFYDQNGIVKNTWSKRYQFNFGADFDIKPWLTLGGEIRYTKNQASAFDESPFSGPLATALSKDPVTPVIDQVTGNWNRSGLTDLGNPGKAAFLTQYGDNDWDRYTGSIRGEIKILPNLKINTQLTLDQRRTSSSFYTPVLTVVEGRNLDNNFFPVSSSNESIPISSLTEQESNLYVLQNSNYMTYTLDKGVHGFSAMVGLESFQRTDQFNRLSIQDVPEPEELRYISLGGELSSLTGQDNESRFRLLSYFTRLNYSFDNKYSLTATVRRDGSSKFAKNNRWGTFPSFSAGWNIQNEDFFPENNIVNRLKLRAGWGQVGNQNPIGNYSTFALLSPNWNYALDNNNPSQGLAADVLPANDLKWEVSEMLNVGLNLGLFEDKLTLEVDYFDKKTKDLLVASIPTPGFAGANGSASNAASMRNTGVEISAQYRHSFSKINMTVGGNIAFIDNIITELGSGDFIVGGLNNQKMGYPATRTLVDYEFASFFTLQSAGIFQNQDQVNRHIALNANGLPIDAGGNPLSDIEIDEQGRVYGFYTNDAGELVRAQARQLQRNAKPGDIIYLDLNNDGKIDENDLTYQGSAIPDFTFGGFLNLNYSIFDLSVSILGSYGNEISNARSYWLQNSNPQESNLLSNRLDRWTSEGSSNYEPRITDNLNDNSLYSDRYIEDGSFLRVRNIQLGITLPQNILDRLPFSGVRVYASADNVFTFTKYSGLDPEIGSVFGDPFAPGVDWGVYPIAKTFIVGTNITF